MKKGFTLVELLAVIVILGVISLIAYAVIQKNIDVTKKSSYETSVKNVIEAAKEYVVTNFEENDFPEGGIDVSNNELNIKNNEFISGVIIRNEEGAIEVVNLTDGNMCANGTKNDLEITYGTCEASDTTPPTLEIKVLKKTANKVRFLVKVQDAQSGLKELKYTYGNEEVTLSLPDKRSMVKKVVEVTGLNAGLNYTFKFTAVNNHNVSDESITTTVKEKEVRLPEVDEPMFKVSSGTYATTKVLTIIYPEVDDYEFSYQIGENVETSIESGRHDVSFDVAENTLVKAFVRKNGEEVISSKLMVSGLDLKAPISKVFIENRDIWTYDKKVYVQSEDEGAGIALRAYSLDNKKSWEKIKTDGSLTTLTENYLFTLKTRDKVGNIQERFYLCEDREFKNCNIVDSGAGNNGLTGYVIEYVDNVAPKMIVEVIRKDGDKTSEDNPWYISNNVTVKVTIYDQASKWIDGKTKIIKSGIGIHNFRPVIKLNNKDVPYDNVFNDQGELVVTFDVTENGTNTIYVSAKDDLENSDETEFIVKKDDQVPTISCGSSYYTFGTNPTSIAQSVTGPSGTKSLLCELTALQLYNRTSKCHIVNNAGVENEQVCKWKVQYAAEAYQSTCTEAYETTCEVRHETWCNGHYCRADGTCVGCNHDYWYSWEPCTEYRTVACTKYRCPQGGYVSGTTCYVD